MTAPIQTDSRYLDALIAKRVMGWTQINHNEVAWFGKPPDSEWATIDVPNYSTDWCTAGAVIDSLAEHYGLRAFPSLWYEYDGHWGCRFISTIRATAYAKTPQRAICLAALMFVDAL